MGGNKGFVTIMSLIIMSIVLIFFLHLMYIFSLEYMIINSTKNSIQSNYFSESKIYLVLNEKKYYNKIISHVIKFLKDIYNTSIKNIRINLNKEDLLDGDLYNLVTVNIFHDYDGRIVLELSTQSTYNKITKQVIAKVTVINEFFESELSIVSLDILDEEVRHEFQDYMNILKEKIEIPDIDKDIYGIEIIDYEKIELEEDLDKNIIKCYRNTMEKPVRIETFISDTVFLITKGGFKTTELSILDLNSDNSFKLSGIIYVEGDLIVQNNFEFNGILIVNGNLKIDSSANMKVKGILLYNGDVESIENSKLQVEYDIKEIRRYGIYLPDFINLNIRNIKSN